MYRNSQGVCVGYDGITDLSETLHFIYLLRLVKIDMVENPDSEFKAIVAEHFIYLQNLLDEGILILAGPCADAAFGIVILRAETIDDAIIIMDDDPAISKGIMTGEIHEFKISLMSSIDTVSS